MDVKFKRNFNTPWGRFKQGLNTGVPDALADRPDWPKDAVIIKRGKAVPLPDVHAPVAKPIHDLDVMRKRAEAEQLRMAQIDADAIAKEEARQAAAAKADADERAEQEALLAKQQEKSDDEDAADGGESGNPQDDGEAGSGNEGGPADTDEDEADDGDGDDDAPEGDSGDAEGEDAGARAARLKKALAKSRSKAPVKKGPNKASARK